MLFKCKDGFVLREDKVYYIKLCEEGYALVYMSYDKETPYTINLEDYFLLATSILKKNENFYITHNGDIFNVKNIMIMGFDNENNYYYAYIFDCKEESSDIFFVLTEEDYNKILEIYQKFYE